MEQQVVLRTLEMQRVEARFGKPIDGLLRDLYYDEGLQLEEIADRLDLTKGTISRWMARFGIEARRRPRKVAV